MTPARFRELRKSLCLTQAELAARLDRSTRQVHDYERGGYPIPRSIALALLALTHGLDAELVEP
jgi:transcriptional regulator with XRE-family HTH domain